MCVAHGTQELNNTPMTVDGETTEKIWVKVDQGSEGQLLRLRLRLLHLQLLPCAMAPTPGQATSSGCGTSPPTSVGRCCVLLTARVGADLSSTGAAGSRAAVRARTSGVCEAAAGRPPDRSVGWPVSRPSAAERAQHGGWFCSLAFGSHCLDPTCSTLGLRARGRARPGG